MKVFKLLSALSSITLLCVISCTMYILYISSPGSTRVKLTHNRAAVTRKKQTTYDWNISEDTRLDQLFAGLTVEPLNATMRATDIDIRGKWQKKQVEKFCSKYQLQNIQHTIPKENTVERSNLFRHILFDDQRQLIFCFLPKVGSNRAKQLILALSGAVPSYINKMRAVPNSLLQKGIEVSSLLADTLSDAERAHKLSTYWKFVIVRNPLERLVSAFRNKLSSPFDRTQTHTNMFEKFKYGILRKYHREKIEKFMKSSDTDQQISVDFETYIRWIVDQPNPTLNEHFAPVIHLAQPCRVRYDFIGNFAQYSADMELVMEKFGIPRELYRGSNYYKSGQNTSTVLQDYYSSVGRDLKLALLKDFYAELDFYYHLFPDERDSYLNLLLT